MATRVGECADGDELSLRPMIKDPMLRGSACLELLERADVTDMH